MRHLFTREMMFAQQVLPRILSQKLDPFNWPACELRTLGLDRLYSSRVSESYLLISNSITHAFTMYLTQCIMILSIMVPDMSHSYYVP